jgi:predicted GNAT family acetyltransferase
MSEQEAIDVAVTDAPEAERFELRVDGELAGFLSYRRRRTLIALDHTQVDPRFEGRGLAGRLVRGALDHAREEGLDVLPFCTFAWGWIARHREYVDLVPAAQRAQFDLDKETPDADR